MTLTLAQTLARLGGPPDPRTDADLLAAFLNHADAAAFEILVRRHGPLVLGTCRRILGPTADAEDAFQATFLVLVRRAKDGGWRETIGPWLYGVAVRVATKARGRRHHRGRVEQQVLAMTAEPSLPPPTPDDLAAVLDEELAKLPDAYRRPLILCELQGLTRKAAAAALNLSEGTLSSRLARGRQMLRTRLTRRGVTATTLSIAATAVVPDALVAATMQGVAGVVPAAVTALTEGVVKAMFVTTRLKLAAVLVAVGAGLTGLGVWSADGPAGTAKAEEPKPGAAPPTKPVPPPALTVPRTADSAVATIFGDEKLTKEQFADYLMLRHGQKELERFVDHTILQRAFGPKGWQVSTASVNAAIDADVKVLGMDRGEYAQALIKLGHPHEELINEFIVPRVMLAELTGTRLVSVSAEELQASFAEKFGEFRTYQHVIASSEADAKAFRAKVKDTPEEFVPALFDVPGPANIVPPPLRMPTTLAGPHPASEVAMHKLVTSLKPGEVSEPVKGADGTWTVALCVDICAGQGNITFNSQKVRLYWDLMSKKLHAEIAKVRNGTKPAAPQYHAFPAPAQHRPVLGQKVRTEVAPPGTTTAK